MVRAGELVSITPKTFQILLVLIRNSREIVTKDDLMKTVWPDTFVEEANLSRNIFMLRKALGETAQDHRYIVTVPGQGYRLAEDVRLVPEQELTVVAASHSLGQSGSERVEAVVVDGGSRGPSGRGRSRRLALHHTARSSSERDRHRCAGRFR